MDLLIAVQENDLEKVNALLSSGFPVDAPNNFETPLYTAVVEGKDVSIIQALLKGCANVHRRTPKYGNSFLHDAPTAEIARELLQHRAEINAVNRLQETPLHFAVQFGKLELVDLLLSAGADVGKGNKIGNTPLHVAVMDPENCSFYDSDLLEQHCSKQPQLQMNILRGLLSHYSSPLKANDNGATPIELAVESMALLANGNGIEVIKELLLKGIDAYIHSLDLSMTFYNQQYYYSRYYIQIVQDTLKMTVLKYHGRGYNRSNLYVPISGYRDIQFEFLEKCERETILMKQHMLYPRVSLYHIVTTKNIKPIYDIRVFLTEDLYTKYPIYEDIIATALHLTLDRGDLFIKFKELPVCSVQDESSGHNQSVLLIPDCLNKIAEYLSNGDLNNFINAMDSK